MRALIVTTMWPREGRPESGSFVVDQVAALRALGHDVEVEPLPTGGPRAYLRAARDLRRRHGRGPAWDVVHAHFGLAMWPALAVPAHRRAVTFHGTDLAHPRSRRVSLAALPRMDVVGIASEALRPLLPARHAGRAIVLSAGVDLDRFTPRPRHSARAALGLPPDEPVLLLPADPSRPEKRADRAREVAQGTRLLTLGGVAPAGVPDHVNAANAVLVPSEREGFGLAVLEALACDVPVLATPVGNHPAALDGIAGALCAPYDAAAWRAAVAPHLAAADPRVDGRDRAARWSSAACAERVAQAWSLTSSDAP
jgi:teichuronic acid biosynthesis glycosyltransferase TuaC